MVLVDRRRRGRVCRGDALSLDDGLAEASCLRRRRGESIVRLVDVMMVMVMVEGRRCHAVERMWVLLLLVMMVMIRLVLVLVQ